MIEHVQTAMVNEYGLTKVHVPERCDESLSKARCPVFMSKEFHEPSEANREKAGLVLIQGTGSVRAGIWARSVCINDDFDLGTMLPQIEWAKAKGYPVLVMNPNHNYDPETREKVPQNGTMVKHALHMWRNYVAKSGFKKLYAIAHSAGGWCLEHIQVTFPSFFT